MKEYFEERTLTGEINVACKFENQPTRYWTTTKQDVVRNIARIVGAYASEGEILTLRQLHYQFVGHVPGYVNHDTAYKKLGSILDDMRYSGLCPWNAFEDRGRKPFLPYFIEGGVAGALQDAVDTYRVNRQEGQKVYIELWTEKDALSAIFSKSTSKYHVHLVINKGYTSSTAAYEAYRRFVEQIKAGKKVVVLYFGDHDPSGLDMVRDIRDRLLFFICRGSEFQRCDELNDWYEKSGDDVWSVCEYYDEMQLAKRLMSPDDPKEKDVEAWEALRTKNWIEQKELFEVKHIGLTMEQIKQFNLPENPTKLTDSRANSYIRKHGKRCWEVDAIDLKELRRILDSNIEAVIDRKLYNSVVANENKDRKELEKVVKKFKK